VEAIKSKGKKAVSAKLEMLKSKDDKTRETAAKALAGVNDKRVISALMKILSKDAHKTVTEAAGEALNSTKEGKIAIRKKLGLVE
jgi:HEAT repeat protein